MSGISFQLSLVGGERQYAPGKILANNCALGETALVEAFQKTDVKLLTALYSKKLKQDSKASRTIDFPIIYEYQRECFTSTNRPDHLLYIHERNDRALQEDWQNARCIALELAYVTDRIYSISFRPVNPCNRQTWYMQKRFYPQDPEVTETDDDLKIRVDHFKTIGSGDLSESPRVMKGMLKPYSTYQSVDYTPDQTLDKLPVELIDEESFQEAPRQFRSQLDQIGKWFQKDDEAADMAIVYFQPDHPTNKICKRVFTKVSTF